ncbi:golgi-associated PDZ and coiled-coil motif-containing -like [Brachionus plicatilis]|uniref:Golgi-associated PDZ and coiled-coil motif-containing-like n=1 Tax=Brachionus plicatilis TaxID=10195 RepID=A0A3M7PAV2_BRAPC|nr:golgi-associated PDZ and coiled-coil motif-containing -like [Brachionus plicatilis]
MSNVGIVSLAWLDTLEKDFDKSFVDLELLLNELANEFENGDLIEDNLIDFVDKTRDKVKSMCCAWAQLVHKSQTVFQVNCKLEAQLVNHKSEVSEAKAFKKASEKELEKLMIELHSCQLQLQKLKHQQTNHSQKVSQEIETPDNTDMIQKKLEEELEKRFSLDTNLNMKIASLESELNEFKKENDYLKHQLVDLNSEIYGARLAAKYLDKELAGRIQQIQLFGKSLKPEEHERLWNQLEAEIHLQRHKTVIRACRSKRLKEGKNIVEHVQPSTSSQKKIVNQTREVILERKSPREGLGISITGGNEHGVPILISEIHSNGPAFRSGELYVGDAILSANDIDLKESTHSDAVEILSNLSGDVKLKVLYVAPDDDSETETSSVNDLKYPFFDNEEKLSLLSKSNDRSIDDKNLHEEI